MVVGDVGNMFGWGGVCGSVAGASGVVWAAQKMPSWYVGVLAGEGCCCVLMMHVFVDVAF